MRRGCWRRWGDKNCFVIWQPGEVLKAHCGGETCHSAVFKELQYLPEGCLVVREVGEVGDTPFVAGDLDNIGREAASATGVKEDQGGATGYEPTRSIVGIGGVVDWEAEALQSGGEIDEPVLLESEDPFTVIDERGVDAAIAFGGAGDALVRGDCVGGTVLGIAHGTMEDGVAFFVDGRVVHAEG